MRFLFDVYLILMSKLPYVIGLTGNIASGKSVVRQYLENAGALTVDADLLAQEAYLPGNTAYQPVLDRFGEDLKLVDGQINRSKLGRLVFKDPAALVDLEHIVHPEVSREINKILEECINPVLVIEAIKLFETDIASHCDQFWVANANHATRMDRLMCQRGLSEEEALKRINSQPAQEEKLSRADVVIHTDQTFQNTYEQVQAALPAPLCAADDGIPAVRVRAPTPAEIASSGLIEPVLDEIAQDAPYRWLSGQSALACFEGAVPGSLLAWKIEHKLGLVRGLKARQHPGEELQAYISALEEHAFRHAIHLLIWPSSLLAARAARELGFEPGEDAHSGAFDYRYHNLLRRNGLMAEEVYLKRCSRAD